VRVKEFVPSAKADSDNKGQGWDAGLKARSTYKRAADYAELKPGSTSYQGCGDAALKGGSTRRVLS
jgi:hypothetical protein